MARRRPRPIPTPDEQAELTRQGRIRANVRSGYIPREEAVAALGGPEYLCPWCHRKLRRFPRYEDGSREPRAGEPPGYYRDYIDFKCHPRHCTWPGKTLSRAELIAKDIAARRAAPGLDRVVLD
jgi:hypothetical protein